MPSASSSSRFSSAWGCSSKCPSSQASMRESAFVPETEPSRAAHRRPSRKTTQPSSAPRVTVRVPTAAALEKS